MPHTKYTRENVKSTTVTARVNGSKQVKIQGMAKLFDVNVSDVLLKPIFDNDDKTVDIFLETPLGREVDTIIGELRTDIERLEKRLEELEPMTLATLGRRITKN